MKRLSDHEYYLEIANIASQRSTCKRNSVGCIIVKDGLVISTGYNGSLPDLPHCSENTESCMFEGHCIRTTHAEINAINRASKNGFNNLKDSILYCTSSPCYACIKTISAFGITEIYFKNDYDDKVRDAYVKLVNLKLIKL